jgi:hypothetical protein
VQASVVPLAVGAHGISLSLAGLLLLLEGFALSVCLQHACASVNCASAPPAAGSEQTTQHIHSDASPIKASRVAKG